MSRTRRSPLKDIRWSWHEHVEIRRHHQKRYRKRANQNVAKWLEPPKWKPTRGYLTW